jgi:hypothetical protein
MSEEKESEGFVIKDKRSSHQSDDEIRETDQERAKEQAKEQARNKEAEAQTSQGPMDINYSTFVLSLTSSAFYYLGDLPDPTTGQVQENLPAVKQTIDILAMLKNKTRGNLDAEEEKLMDQLIYELQMKYVAKQNKQPNKT